MAVTQQLARVTEEFLARCRTAARESPDGDPGWDPPREDVLDLDWAPASLKRVCRAAGAAAPALAAPERALDGDPEVTVAFLDHPEAVGVFGPPPGAVAPAGVTLVAEGLAAIDWDAVRAHGADHGLPGVRDPWGYLTGHFTALRAFYEQASRRGLYVVGWWD
ncbi:DUF1877 domain-containing protein [Actinacidiphila glaucinigra]|uniref:DUF1877 domain-containing protein n=1 Tax=Actinacidiphila glaucinigra TaxID=235986 RepID=UPI0037C74916